MKWLLFFVLFSTSTSVFAQESVFSGFLRNWSDKYSEAGQSNNEIYWRIELTSDLAKLVKLWSITPQYLSSITQIEKCLFMDKGAYVTHLDKKTQQALARSFMKSLQDHFLIAPNVYVVYNVQMEVENNNCAILLVDTLVGEAALAQGVSWD